MLRVDYVSMHEAARKLNDEGDTFSACIDSMTSVVNGLPDIWEAETCDRYVEQYTECKKTLDEVRELIADLAAQMNKIADNFEQADRDMKNMM